MIKSLLQGDDEENKAARISRGTASSHRLSEGPSLETRP